MQSGVTTARLEPPLSVCPRLRTGTHSSDRKVRPNSVQLLHYPSIHSSIFPPIHPFTGLHSPCLPFSGTQLLTVLWHPPVCLPTHLLMFSLFPPAQYLHYLTTSSLSPLSVLLSVSETARLPLLLNTFSIYFCPKNAQPLSTELISTLLPSLLIKLALPFSKAVLIKVSVSHLLLHSSDFHFGKLVCSYAFFVALQHLTHFIAF